MNSLETSSSLPKPEFSVRIVVCDYYVAKPTPGIDIVYSEFRGSDIKQVPVLRIFGPAADGYKTCLHVHGIFPYFYIPCPMPNPEPQFLYQIAASLDKALNIALKQATSTNQHVYKITLVKGLPFYGYHDKEHLYLKVFLYNPGLIKQAVELCSNGAIFGQVFQPHESHLNFTLQFFIDFNLFGMSCIDIETLKFRSKGGVSQKSNDPFDECNENALKPESICYYEADCFAFHIMNRQRIGRGDGIENPGLEEVWNQEQERRKQLNMSVASKSLTQGRINSVETDSHYKYDQMFWIKIGDLMEKPVDVSPKAEMTPIHYPAESLVDSQVFDGVDISCHSDNVVKLNGNEELQKLSNDSLYRDVDTTIVDETIALNSSLPICYSQVFLDNEDMDLIDMLKEMEEQPIDKDSILGTPSNLEKDELSGSESEDAEYSQIFEEDTVMESTLTSNIMSNSELWHDSYWDEANIPQLDGTYDDEHSKRVRKRKMRPLKLGLSRIKSQKTKSVRPINEVETCEESKASVSDQKDKLECTNNIDEIKSKSVNEIIKADRSIIDAENNKVNVNELQCTDRKKENVALEIKLSNALVTQNMPKSDYINKIDGCMISEHYDMLNGFEVTAGSSNVTIDKKSNCDADIFDSESDHENHLGIQSFYNTSKIFNTSIEENDVVISKESSGDLSFLCLKKEEPSYNTLRSSSNSSLNLRLSEDSDAVLSLGSKKNVVLTPRIKPPAKEYILSTLREYNIPKIKNVQPSYSNFKDVGDKVEIGHMILKLQSNIAQHQKPLEKTINALTIEEWRHILFTQNNETDTEISNSDTLKGLLASNRYCILEPVMKPPTTSDIHIWLKSKAKESDKEEKEMSSIPKEISEIDDELDDFQALGLKEGSIHCSYQSESNKDVNNLDETAYVTMQTDGSYLCFGNGSSQHEQLHMTEVDFLTIMTLELHTTVRGVMNPDPEYDEIKCVFINITNDCPSDHYLKKSITEIYIMAELPPPKKTIKSTFNTPIIYVTDEKSLIERVIETVKRHDPDIICGYEIEMNSWGYFLDRCQILGFEIIREISRITEKNRQKRWRADEKDYEGRILGRVIFNVWRLLRHELALSSYSFENCVYQILNERVPKYSYAQLEEWWKAESNVSRWILIEYYLTKLSGTVRMLQKLDIIKRTSELARLFGLQWWEVLSRGSQFRVESLMLRAARPLNLVALSPTVKQRAAMKAPECLPLIFEPESRFYADPVIVLDFQSLYPSMMIAYNYCFSTCIGRVQHINGEQSYEFGAWRLRIPKTKLETLVKKGLIHWSPVGVGFVKPSVRRGVLPALLRRILAARQAVKKSMKLQTDEAVKKTMHSRQLGLKLIANVTYGYTAANFSGRMPCVEVGDSVVAKGRETLERAVKLVENNQQWNVKVVYGDTDSMFVLVPGGTRVEAFEIGRQIADAVTADNPSPVALKLEKVYQPCILQTKKRYVGYMYESPDQEKPIYEAKGIETVRRDGCPTGVKLLQQSLCELFDSADVSKVKQIVTATLSRLADSRLPHHELLFTREYNGPHGYRPGAAAPPAEIAKRLASQDRRAVPRTGERVSWVVCAGAPGLPLIKMARTPAELKRDPSLKPHITYYATRVILPPLHRCLSLLGVNVFKWWTDLGYTREISVTSHVSGMAAGGIARYLWRERCAVCTARSQRSICGACVTQPQRAIATIAVNIRDATTHAKHCTEICTSCCGHQYSICCENLECPVLWRRQTSLQRLDHVQDIVKLIPSHMKCSLSLDF